MYEIQDDHKKYCWHTNYGMATELQTIKTNKNKTIIEKVWETYFSDEQPAEPAVPAQPAKPFVAAHFEEKRIKK